MKNSGKKNKYPMPPLLWSGQPIMSCRKRPLKIKVTNIIGNLSFDFSS